MNLNLFACPFYLLQLKHKAELEYKLNQSNLTLKEIEKANAYINVCNKVKEQNDLNNNLLSKQHKEIINFKHCDMCLLIGGNK